MTRRFNEGKFYTKKVQYLDNITPELPISPHKKKKKNIEIARYLVHEPSMYPVNETDTDNGLTLGYTFYHP